MVILYSKFRIRIICRKTEFTYAATKTSFTDLVDLKKVASLSELYDSYTKFVASCLLLLIIRAIALLTFTRHMTLLITVIYRYSVNLFFFLVMFMFLLFGFSFAGFLAFGTNTMSFRNIWVSFITCFKMSAGDFGYDELKAADYIFAPIFFVIFCLLFYVVLLGIIKAIVAVGHERTMYAVASDEHGEGTESVIQTVKNELRRQFAELARTTQNAGKTVLRESDIVSLMPLISRVFSKLFRMKYGLNGIISAENKVKEEVEKSPEKYESLVNDSEPKMTSTVSPMAVTFLKNMSLINNPKEMIVKDKEMNEVERAQAIMWMSALESTLKQKLKDGTGIFDLIKRSCDNEIVMEFYPKETLDDLKDHVKNFIYATRMSVQQKQAWDNGNLAKKYEYWCGMDTVHSEYYNNTAEENIIACRYLSTSEELRNSKNSESIIRVNGEAKSEKKEANHDYGNRQYGNNEEKFNGKGKDEANECKVYNVKEEDNKAEENNNNEDNGEQENNKGESKVKENRGDVVEEMKSFAISESSQSSISLNIPNGIPLVPPQGNITFKNMLTSLEYTSNYAQRISSIQFDYWNTLTLNEKIEFWLFHLTGKQRVKLWTTMRFCKTTVIEYINTNLPKVGVQGLHDVWKYLSNVVKEDLIEGDLAVLHKIGLAKSKCFLLINRIIV